MKRLKKSAVWVAFAMAIGGHVVAQPAQPTAPKAADKAEPALPKLGPDEAKKQAQELRNQVRVHIQHVQHLQAQARKEKDVIKLSCVNDKFIKLKAEANIFDLTHRELLALLDSEAQRSALFARTSKAASDVRKVREEADACIGEPQLGQDSESDFVAPDLLDDPTLGLPFDISVEPPAYASPYT